MGEVYMLAALALAVASVGWLATVAIIKRKPGKPGDGGTWRRIQETFTAETGGVWVRVVLVREYEGVENSRLPVYEIDLREHDWDDRYLEAIAEADTKLAQLNEAERH